jgi:hypothetical protein
LCDIAIAVSPDPVRRGYVKPPPASDVTNGGRDSTNGAASNGITSSLSKNFAKNVSGARFTNV